MRGVCLFNLISIIPVNFSISAIISEHPPTCDVNKIQGSGLSPRALSPLLIFPLDRHYPHLAIELCSSSLRLIIHHI